MKWVKRGFVAVLVIFIAIQFVPYGRNHENPPVVAEPAWDSPQTRELAVKACYDCHSNEVDWKWYHNVAPLSWYVGNEVAEGREELNFSEWGPGQEGDEAAETVRDGSMPPFAYKLTRVRLSDAELKALELGFIATFGNGEGEGGGSGGDDDEGDNDD